MNLNKEEDWFARFCLIAACFTFGLVTGLFLGTKPFIPCQRADIITGETTIFLVIGSDIDPKNRTKLIEWCKGN